MTNHSDDRHVVAAAIIAKAEVIVTSNLKHFPAEALAPFGIEAWHPDDFLAYLYDFFSEKIIQVIQQQSEDLNNPPLTCGELLDRLEHSNRLLKFVGKVRSHE
jgi:hypothetical protein